MTDLEAYTEAVAADTDGDDCSALCWGLIRLSVMKELPTSRPLATSSAKLHSKVHCSTSSLRGLRSVTLLHV